jgi:hypothetical protein
MFYYLRVYRRQIKKFRERGLCSSPFRYFSRWKRSLQPGANSVRDRQPWITFETIDFLTEEIKPGQHVFEFGGGGSTLFFVGRAAQVVTIEHNREWFEVLEKLMQGKNETWQGNFIPPENGDLVPSPDPSDPAHYSSRDDDRGFNFRAYATAIDAYPDRHFDFVLVDGRARPSCIAHSFAKIKTGGFLVVDNSDRDYYFTHVKAKLEKDFSPVIHNFGPSPYTKDFTRTSIWKKKA